MPPPSQAELEQQRLIAAAKNGSSTTDVQPSRGSLVAGRVGEGPDASTQSQIRGQWAIEQERQETTSAAARSGESGRAGNTRLVGSSLASGQTTDAGAVNVKSRQGSLGIPNSNAASNTGRTPIRRDDVDAQRGPPSALASSTRPQDLPADPQGPRFISTARKKELQDSDNERRATEEPKFVESNEDPRLDFDALFGVNEGGRRLDFDDGDYVTEGGYVFELRAGGRTEWFSLVLNPDTETLEEQFSVALTPTLQGGIFAEENGIIIRPIMLAGTFGLEPKINQMGPYGSDSENGVIGRPVNNPSHARRFDAPNLGAKLSGQRHFQILQDFCFRKYADLKRNPAKSAGTRLYLHVVKDREHWRVIPLSFKMMRDAQMRTLYRYEIDLVAVDPYTDTVENKQQADEIVIGDAVRRAIDPQKADLRKVLTGLTGARAFINKFLSEIRGILGTITDLVAAAFRSITDVIQLVTDIITAVVDFVNGVVTLLTLPFKLVKLVIDAVSGIINFVGGAISSFGSEILGTFRGLELSLLTLRTNLKLFGDSGEESITDSWAAYFRRGGHHERVDLNGFRNLSSIAALNQFGTGATPNDLLTIGRGLSAVFKAFGALDSVTVTDGDTLQGIAARRLGDPTRWHEIASINNLLPPFISDAGLPGTARFGQLLLVPDQGTQEERFQSTATFGGDLYASFEERTLGVDLMLIDTAYRPPAPSNPLAAPYPYVPNGSPIFDLEVDETGTDFKLVRGIDNLKQGLRSRVHTEQGEMVLYPNYGVPPLVGMNVTDANRSLVAIQLTSAIESDQRISHTRKLSLEGSGLDILAVEFEAVIKGFAAPQSIRVQV